MRVIDVPSEWRERIRIVTDVTDEDLERHLAASERADLGSLRVRERQLERGASRIAGRLLLSETMNLASASEIEFAKEEDRPFARVRDSRVFVSFSHSSGVGAAAAGSSPVGIDLETFREIRPEMTRFFLTAAERSEAERIDAPRALLHFWSAKEAAFKQTGSFPTLLKVPLRLERVASSGLTFEVIGTSAIVETRLVGDRFLLALATM